MTESVRTLPADLWMLQLFSAKTAREGGVVRRKVRDVDRTVGRAAFIAEIRRRGFHLVENGGHFVVFCNSEPLHLHATGGTSGPNFFSRNLPRVFRKLWRPRAV